MLHNTLRIESSLSAALLGLGHMEQGFHETVMQSTAVIQCAKGSNGGIGFLNVSSILISRVTIVGCGQTSQQPAIGIFIPVNTVVLANVAVLNSTGLGMNIMAVSDSVNITSCSLAANKDDGIHIHIGTGNVLVQDTNITFSSTGAMIYSNALPNSLITHVTFNNVNFLYNNIACEIPLQSSGWFNIQNSIIAYNMEGFRVDHIIHGKIIFENTNFTNNRKQSLKVWNKVDNGAYEVVLQKVNVFKNGGTLYPIVAFHGSTSKNYKAISVNHTNNIVIVTIADSTFHSNNATALYLLNTTARFQGMVIFSDNSGNDGGAIKMNSKSKLQISQATQVHFVNNHVRGHGGAIYVLPSIDDEGHRQQIQHCFYTTGMGPKYKENANLAGAHKRSVIYFSNNTAVRAGSAVYGANTTLCHTNTLSFNNQPGYSVFSSHPNRVCFCDKETSKPLCDIRNQTISAVPGELINLSVAAIGDRDGLSEGELQVYTTNTICVDNYTVPADCVRLSHSPSVQYDC